MCIAPATLPPPTARKQLEGSANGVLVERLAILALSLEHGALRGTEAVQPADAEAHGALCGGGILGAAGKREGEVGAVTASSSELPGPQGRTPATVGRVCGGGKRASMACASFAVAGGGFTGALEVLSASGPLANSEGEVGEVVRQCGAVGTGLQPPPHSLPQETSHHPPTQHDSRSEVAHRAKLPSPCRHGDVRVTKR
jgi:hypothetical protein